jgi:GntR family transcriptional regulator
MKLNVDKPLQAQIQDAVLDLIRNQKIKPGEQLPTESELIKLLKVGRSTLREALANLVHQGVLYKVQGKGTFVREIPIVVENGLEVLRGVTENILAVGATPNTSRMTVKKIEAGKSLAKKLKINPSDKCYWVERVRRADDVVAVYCIDILPVSMTPDNFEEEEFKGSIFGILEKSGHIVSYTETSIHPTILTKRDLPEMKTEIGMFLLLEEIYYDTTGTPVSYGNDYYSAEIFDFKIGRKRQL